MPAMRSALSGVVSTLFIMCLAPPGKAASTSPSRVKNKPSATMKSDIAGSASDAAALFVGGARRICSGGRSAGRGAIRDALAGRIAEIAEEVGIGPEHQMRVAALHAPLISLHGAIEAEEIGVLAIGLGEDAVAFGVALAAKRFGLRIGLGEQDRHVAVRPGADFLALLAALGAEIGRLALPFGLHALVDRLAVLLGKIDAADADVDNVDAERPRVAVELIAHLPHQILAAVAHRVGERRRAEH